MLLQFFRFDGWLGEMNLFEHPDILINLLLQLIFSIYIIQGSLYRRITLHSLRAYRNWLVSHVGDACQIYENLFCYGVVPDTTLLSPLFSNHCHKLVFLRGVSVP